MERLTTSAPTHHWQVPEEAVEQQAAGGWCGPAIDRLGAYESLHEVLFIRKRAIPEEMERLRAQGRDKTVSFKELLTEKLMVELFLSRLAQHGLK